MIFFDRPGYGESRPPERDWDASNYYEKDADVAEKLMKVGYLQN